MALSPDSPIPDFWPSLPESIPYFIGYRSTSPESMCSDMECGTLPLMSLFYEDRPRSLTSVWSDNECELSDIFSTIFSDKDRPSSEAFAFWQRPDSPESIASVDEYRALSPDSPIPEFRQDLPESVTYSIGYRSSSPESVTSDIEYDLFISEVFFIESRPDSPESIVSDTEERPLSPESLSEYCPMSPESVMLLTNVRSSSPESTASVDEFRCLSPDSPLPQYLQHYPEPTLFMARSRSSSPVSVLSDLEYETELFSFTSMLFEDRPDSVASVDDYRALSPDSPIPEFRQNLLEYFVDCRSSSPESVTSDIEYANSPSESVMRVPIYKFVYDADRWKLISPIHDPQYVGETFASKTGMFEYCGSTIEYVQKSELLSQTLSNESGLRSDSPESVKSMDEHRSLSPDSPIPQYLQYFPEPVMFMAGSRPSSPDSVSSEEIGHMLSEAFSFWQRPGSPDSIASVDEYRALSPDSPIPEFRQDLPESVTYSIGYRSSSPESVTSDIEYDLFISEVFFIESRPDSPESIVSDTEERPLSPESLSEYCPMSPESVMLLTNVRSSSPESTASVDEFRCLSPDSPLPQYLQYFPEPTIFMTGSRSSSPASVLSDKEFENELFLHASMLFDDRPSSPDSIVSIDEYRTLSPDSPIPEFRQALRESIVSMIGYRSSSPESLSGYETESETEFAPLISEIEERQDTPDSTTSVDEFRALSPDSPVPQYTQHGTTTLIVTGNRSASPESICSDMESETDLFLHTSMLSEDRPSSPDSIASIDEYRALSPDSPIPEFLHVIPECVTSSVYGYRSSSPESVISGTSEVEDITSEAFAFWQRPDSPESTASVDENRCLSPDSPLPQYFDYFPEPTLFMAGSRSSSPASVLSDDDYDLSDIFLTLFSERGRPSSPESVASVDEYMALSPDSPIPDFWPSLPESIPYFIGYRSTSPESMCSDMECGTLPLMSLFYEDRPRSLTSVWSDNECELSDIFLTIFSDKDRPSSEAFAFWQRPDSPESIVSDTEERPLSPESLSEYCPMSPESVMLLTNVRSSSPESTASVDEFRCLSPDSPLPQYLQYFPEPTIFMTGSRSSSPASVLSDKEFENELFLHASMLFDDRASSPDSIVSIDEYRTLSPDSPIPEFRQALRESIVSMIGYRSSSPESLSGYETESETEFAPLISEIEERQDTPDSTTSVDEFRALSPDSPVPQYTQHGTTTLIVTGNRSASPESICSDMESETDLFLHTSMLFENRPSSPDSIASVDEYRTLSPDSPIPEFRQVLRESMIGYRSSSPESVASDVEYAPLISESSSVELRPDSPESVASVNGHRSFSPQSPVPLFTPIALGSSTVETGCRSSSPLSITSDTEFDLVFSDIEETVLPTKSLIPEHVSPSEILSIEATEQKPKAASSDSPVPGTAMMVEEYNLMYDTELCKLISQIHDAQYVGETFLSKTGFLEYTGSSEAYVETSPGEEDVARGSTDVSPEAVPGPQVEPAATTETAKIDQDVALTESIECIQTYPEEREVARGSTEISTEALPDWQVEPSETTTETVKIDQDVAPTESVPSVSDIVLPESLAAEVVSECTFETGHRSASPHSKTDSGDEWVIVSVSETEDKPISPESLPDCRPISPATLVLKADVRTSSPESVLFEKQVEKDRPLSTESVEYRTMSLESTMSMDKVRSSSPESMHEINDNRSLSPDSPIPQYTRSGVSGIDSCNMEYATIEHRSSSPESMTSGSEYELMVISSSALESRPSSPDSLESVGRNRRLSPDSPVPEFMRILSQYFMEPRALSERTSSPESVSSDTVFLALPVDSWADVHRRQSSPESGASDEELSLVITSTEAMTFKAGALSHVTSVLKSERVPMSPEENTVGVTLLPVPATKFEKEQGQMSTTDQELPRVSGLVAEMVITSTEQARTKRGSEHAETIPTPQATMGLENVKKVQKDVQVKQQPVKVKDRSEEEVEVLRLSADSIKTQDAPQRAPSQTAKEIQLKTSYGKMQSKLESTLVTESTLHEQKAVLDLSQETSISGLVSPKQTKTATGYKPLISTPLQISEQYPFTTHRAVTPKLKVLDSATQEFSDWSEFTQEEFEETHSGELFSPMSSQFLVPPDYEALFSGRHSLRVSECSQLSPTDMSPVSPVFSDPQSDNCQVTTTTLMGPEFASKSATPGSAEAFEFSPDFKRVIGEFEKTLSSFGPVVQSDPAQENSDLEFFDCKDDFSDFSEAEDLEPEEPEVLYHIEEPPSPTPFCSTLETGFLKGSPVCSAQFLRVDDQNRFSLGSESLGDYGIYDGPESESETVPTCEELPSRSQAGYDDDEYSLEREINEELGLLSSDSSEEEVLTTRVVRRRVIIQADDLPDIPPQTVTEEQYMDEHGNLVVKKITRKVIRKYFSPDGVEREEVTVEGSHQEMVSVEEGDGFSKVVKRTVVRSEGDQTELTFLEPLALGATTASDFESEQVQGRKVSKVVKTTVVRGERMEKQTGDSTLAADLPSAKEDFEKNPDA
ncbi:ankyrin-2b isoform X2 [Oncorhynchus nerka]|uniref:ankyrin-2b isoform X2 n=1 Tax=Oncorhynchus nerka TaxID=8023 RepID=UPI0031B85CDA